MKLEAGSTMPRMPEWVGSPGFRGAWKAMEGIPSWPPQASPEQTLIKGALAGVLSQARPILCPPSQLAAVDEDVFPNLASAIDYTARSGLPFQAVFLDFSPAPDEPPATLQVTRSPNPDLDGFESPLLELLGVAVWQVEVGGETAFLPVIREQFGELQETGIFTVGRKSDAPPGESLAYGYPLETPAGTFNCWGFTAAAVQQYLGEEMTTDLADVQGTAPAEPDHGPDARFPYAIVTTLAFQLSLRALYLLDAANIELASAPLTRGDRRRAERKKLGIASLISVARKGEADSDGSGNDTSYSHQFEVRGNFAHYGPETRLFQHSDPADIRPCPRCGTCRRVWRRPHIKGPSDKPLVLKARQIGTARIPRFGGPA